MYINVHNVWMKLVMIMKVYMASFTKLWTHESIYSKCEWMRKLFIEEVFVNLKIEALFEIRKSAAFYKVIRTSSFMPIHMKSCNAFMKRYHLKNVQKTK